LTVD